MDPLTILSVAAAVAQFLDFASGIIVNTKEAYESSVGQSQNDIELSKIARDLSSLTHNLSSKMSKLMQDDNSENAVLEVEREAIDILLRLCRESKAINKEIQAILTKLRVQGTTKIRLAAESFVVALRRVWSADKIQHLEHRLDENRKQITMAMLVVSWGQAENDRITMKQFAEDRRFLIDQLKNIDDITRSYGQQILQLIRPQTESKQQEAREILAYAIDSRWVPSSFMTTETEEMEELEKSDHIAIRMREERIAEMIMNSLSFETIDHRESTVPKAYSDTFEWVFGNPQTGSDGTPRWSDLREWATGQSKLIYWISGKAGAGKSTLTKFLAGDKRLEDYLQQWSNPCELLLATYYSWNAGNKLQKSHQGLFRAILHQCLKRFPRQLVPKVFPNRWALVQLFSPDTPVALPDWRPWELLAGFRALLSLADQGPLDGGLSIKVALVIDGLDEFDDDEDHVSLVELLQEAATYNNVKLCASSRPWNVFRDAFNQNPMLQLEKLTHTDIKRYVHGQFRKSPGFSEMKHLHPVQAKKLLSDIVQKAQGVFLWVSVVVRSLLLSFQEGDKLSDVQATLDSLPEDLDRLFLAIWRRTNPINNVEGAHYFLLLDVCQEHDLVPYASTIFWGDDDAPTDLETAIEDDSFVACAISSLSRRLNSRTRGLLEIYGMADTWSSRVDYMHRTVKEWVRDNWDMITSSAKLDFDAHFWVLKGEVLRMAMLGNVNIELSQDTVCHHLQKLFTIAARADSHLQNTEMLVQVLNKLDSTLMKPLKLGSAQSHTPSNHTKKTVTHWSNHLHSYKAWMPIRRLCSKGWRKHDFLRLMAQLPIPQYVQYTLGQNASASKPEPEMVPLLVSAVIGGCQENPETWHPRTRSESERLDFVKFTLQHVSFKEVQETLVFLHNDSFFCRSWDAEFIAATRDILNAYLCAKGLPLLDFLSCPDSAGNESDAVEIQTAPGSTTTTLVAPAQKPKHHRKSIGRWAKALFRRSMST
ncbi:hypothetical protein F5B22DRAFT_532208 [Xylaria bambusicola]|uniref:uncharacterized protein n=1 Tax=Xylaria bambusicola TaxID=326684 RepID=UPI002007FB9E|nr:uncharacterized protein F5B22DRAFT_532208 [Xylaria bambusicola]KAI0505287.1 hypothetical protein F5B22DRAFT_532208 [Xylaria bambusicola]